MTHFTNYFKNKFRISSARLKHWDYSSSGWYFVTICTYNKICCFGDIVNGKMKLSKIGEIAKKFWLKIPKHFSNVFLDEFIIMPNHIHGIVVIKNDFKCRDVINHVSTKNKNFYQKISPMNKKSLGEVIRWFKSITTFNIHKQNINFHWQSRFYDHIIRNEKSLNEIRQYIKNNPLKWEFDTENPTAGGKK